jgi:hypothetical protein
MNDVVWSSTPPRTPGRYYYRLQGSKSTDPAGTAVVVRRGRKLVTQATSELFGGMKDVTTYRRDWAGPLPGVREPSAPKPWAEACCAAEWNGRD